MRGVAETYAGSLFLRVCCSPAGKKCMLGASSETGSGEVQYLSPFYSPLAVE